jgi:murein DD-endopeptidase MepM/ murein hydrolase activator NlpD
MSARWPTRAGAGLVAILAAGGCGGPRTDHHHDQAHWDRQASDEALQITRVLRRPVPHATPAPGWVLPYPLDRVLSTFGDCRDGGRRQHRGIDLGGTGPLAGLGTPIRAMAAGRITLLGRPEEDPRRFGRPDTRSGTTERGRQTLPRSLVVPGYGTVHFFTREAGSWRSGTVVVTVIEEGPHAGWRIRYMHLGAIAPHLEVGETVEAGQPIGLMGGTAVQSSTPHVHIDIEDAEGRRVDPGPLLGLPADTRRCASATR